MKHFFLTCISVMLFMFSLQSQAVYNMRTLTVDDCKGTLLGSGEGALPGHYDHNENYTFTICIPGAQSISVNFTSFCTEANYDILRIFDGPDTFATQLGPGYSGTTIPPAIMTSGNCITFHFVSDANVTCTGWTANWRTQIDTPRLPEIDMSSFAPTCSSTVLVAQFTEKIDCDSILGRHFSIQGIEPNTIVNAVPVGCINDSTQAAQITITPGLNESGWYSITYRSYYLDACDSLWTIVTTDSFAVRDCPLRLNLYAQDDTICEGDCTDIIAEVEGGDFLTYQYAWSGGLTGPGPHTICPPTTVTVNLTVSDQAGSTPANGSVTVTVLPAPQTNPSVTVCVSDPQLTLPVATPAGGQWSGRGVVGAATGLFDPGAAGTGTHSIIYTGPNGCDGVQTVVVTDVDAEGPYAACPSSGFMPLNGQPVAGFWTGPNVVGANRFQVPAFFPDTFLLYYNAPNGCQDSAFVFVDTITMPLLDTLCESQNAFNLGATPRGGDWSGTGINNRGLFDPGNAGPGRHTLTYDIFGCSKTIDVFVKNIQVQSPQRACPTQPAWVLPAASPVGGVWSGMGILNPVTGLYDPSVRGRNFNDTLVYTIDGCDAKMVMYIRQTNIGRDSLEFCSYDNPIDLNWASVRRTPSNGVWSGMGITDPDNPGEFDPSVAGGGEHQLIYLANTCADTMTMFVEGPALPEDLRICSGTAPFQINANPGGGQFQGPGTDPMGLFDPADAGVGMHVIYYESLFGCDDSMEIEVYAPVVPDIQGLEPVYCYRDTNIMMTATVPGGTFSGPGVSGNLFNPATAGPGQHVISYEAGQGACKRSNTYIVTVGDPLVLQLAFDLDSICPGEFVNLAAVGSGGSTGDYRFRWSPGNGLGPGIPVSPAVTTVYTVTLTDGCTEPVTGDVTIQVAPDFEIDIMTSDIQCFGEMGFATANIIGPSQYNVVWETSPPVFDPTLIAPTGFNYPVRVRDIISGCEKTALTDIPFHPFVRANFILNPSNECIRLPDAELEIIDQSTGGVFGTWEISDGNSYMYVPGQNIKHRFAEVDSFFIELVIENDGGCRDTLVKGICVAPEEPGFHMPNAFSPNNDGHNEIFKPAQIGVERYLLQIFDRWGNVIWQGTDPNTGWDGTYSGNPVPEGVYVYYVRGTIVSDNPRTGFAPVTLERTGTVTLIR